MLNSNLLARLKGQLSVPVLLFLLLPSASSWAQKAIKAKCTAVLYEVRLRDVNYKLLKDDVVQQSTFSGNGKFKFEIPSKQHEYRVILEKPGYVIKEVVFDSKEYPFEKRYDKLSLDLELMPLKEDSPTRLIYTLGFQALQDDYEVTSIDTVYADREKLLAERGAQQNEAKHKIVVDQETNALQMVFDTAVAKANKMWNQQQFGVAKEFYQIANTAIEGNEHVLARLAQADSAMAAAAQKLKKTQDLVVAKSDAETVLTEKEKRNEKSEKTDEKLNQAKNDYPEEVWYSVQIGAFFEKMNKAVYKDVPDYMLIQGEVYKRCFSGIFTTRKEAFTRRKQMIAMGFKDAFVVTMQGKERIGF